jgi:deferrochelatase/peroxidase EfeB
MLRRGFSYSSGFTADGQLDQGLVFICFQRDLDEAFVATQSRLDGEPLEEYITPVGGGYFFVPPGARTSDDWVGSGLFA